MPLLRPQLTVPACISLTLLFSFYFYFVCLSFISGFHPSPPKLSFVPPEQCCLIKQCYLRYRLGMNIIRQVRACFYVCSVLLSNAPIWCNKLHLFAPSPFVSERRGGGGVWMLTWMLSEIKLEFFCCCTMLTTRRKKKTPKQHIFDISGVE